MDDRNIRNICQHCSALWINNLKQWFPNLVFVWWTPAEPSTKATIFTNAFMWMDFFFFFFTRCWLYKYDNTIFPHKKDIVILKLLMCRLDLSFFFFSSNSPLCYHSNWQKLDITAGHASIICNHLSFGGSWDVSCIYQCILIPIPAAKNKKIKKENYIIWEVYTPVWHHIIYLWETGRCCFHVALHTTLSSSYCKGGSETIYSHGSHLPSTSTPVMPEMSFSNLTFFQWQVI